ncbi:STM4015 family protein [Nocardia sp. XZ_19_385]|uniref:STM4015 family protein n=1 Tax=Nocardia sp. XZ_19_385 TaxID=2769488 RepID=UPI00189079ED|nr:STM4015 family protein [Nocardia sp. XZ_19_385]
MAISDHMEEFHGLPVFEFPDAATTVELPAPGAVAWRIGIEPWDSKETWAAAFARFLDAVDSTAVRALVVGVWGEGDDDSEPVVAALVEAKDRLPALRALFVGDITFDENECSWIHQSDVTPLLETFPKLREFGFRGGENMRLRPFEHTALRSLSVQTGGLDVEIVRAVAASDLPALERLDLWLGTSEYGATAEVSDLEPILSGTQFPALTSLALRNSEIQDQIAIAIASAPVVARLSTLDLSMGTLGDEGAAALLEGQPLTHLKTLDLHHHFISSALSKRLAAALEPSGVEVILSDEEEAEIDDDREWRYVAVGE